MVKRNLFTGRVDCSQRDVDRVSVTLLCFGDADHKELGHRLPTLARDFPLPMPRKSVSGFQTSLSSAIGSGLSLASLFKVTT